MSFALQNNEDALGQVKGLSIHLRPHKSRSRRWLVDHNWNILEALVLWTPSCLATLKFHVFAYSVVSEGASDSHFALLSSAVMDLSSILVDAQLTDS